MGHVVKLVEAAVRKRPVRQILDHTRPGQSTLRWFDRVTDDLASFDFRNWKGTDEDREKWQQALEKAKTHTGLLMMMSMITYHLQLHFSE
jgi:hypothetical protein